MVSPGQAQMLLPVLVDEGTEGHRGPVAVPLQHHPGVLALVSEATGAGDVVKHALARRLGRKAARYHRRVYLAEDADERGVLGRQRHHHLRLDRPILDAIDNDLLDLRGRLAGGRN